MPEYRKVRERTTFQALCRNPQLCSEVMCLAVERLGVDAAIVFSDLLPILEPMGLELEFAKGEGPVIYNPVRAAADVDRIRELEDLSSLDFVFETVRLTRADLPSHLPLIGFAARSLASYAIEGVRVVITSTPDAHVPRSRRVVGTDGATSARPFIAAQIAAGAQPDQLFDSWVGCLGVDDYGNCAAVEQVVRGILPACQSLASPPAIRNCCRCWRIGRAIGVDWRVRLDEAWRMSARPRVQGLSTSCGRCLRAARRATDIEPSWCLGHVSISATASFRRLSRQRPLTVDIVHEQAPPPIKSL